MTTAELPCGCPTGPHSTITDQARHDAWHAEVFAQGGPDRGPVDLRTMQKLRGMSTQGAPAHKIDERHVRSGKRASGARREAAR